MSYNGPQFVLFFFCSREASNQIKQYNLLFTFHLTQIHRQSQCIYSFALLIVQKILDVKPPQNDTDIFRRFSESCILIQLFSQTSEERELVKQVSAG